MRAVSIALLCAFALLAVATTDAVRLPRRLRPNAPPPSTTPVVNKPNKENQACMTAGGPGICWVKITCDKHKGKLYDAITADATGGKCPNAQKCCRLEAPSVTDNTTPVAPTPAPVTPAPPAPMPVTPPCASTDYACIMKSIAPGAGVVERTSFRQWQDCSVSWVDMPVRCRCRARAQGREGVESKYEPYACITQSEAMIKDGCMWSIEDDLCVSKWDVVNVEAVGHASKYTWQQVKQYYDAKAVLNKPKPVPSYLQDDPNRPAWNPSMPRH